MESATPSARSKEMKTLFVKILNLEQKAQGCDLVNNWLYSKQEARAQATEFEKNVREFEAQFGGETIVKT